MYVCTATTLQDKIIFTRCECMYVCKYITGFYFQYKNRKNPTRPIPSTHIKNGYVCVCVCDMAFAKFKVAYIICASQ